MTKNTQSAGSGRMVYEVTHCAFKTEYVVAESQEQAWEAANTGHNGWGTGDYDEGEVSSTPHLIGDAEDLQELPQIGSVTVQRLLNSDSAIPLGPRSATRDISDSTATRLRNRLEETKYRLMLERGGSSE